MNILSIFYNIIIAPIETFIEFVFCFYNTKIGVFGVAGAIIAVSFAVNFLALPIYNIADNIQKRERNVQKKLSSGITRIKSTFSGDERFMMMETYYKENGYHPLYALRSSLSIMIEIPFFIAAYHFLSHCPALKGSHLGFIEDLSHSDALISIAIGMVGGGYRLNLLPLIMTAINVLSSFIYLRGLSMRDKIQTYALSLIFLFLLYNSPSGLVFYWILNNIFSLTKNIVTAICKRPRRIVYIFISAMLLAIAAYLLCFRHDQSLSKRLVVISFAFIFVLSPFLVKIAKRLSIDNSGNIENTSSFMLFLASDVAIALLCGMVLPSSVIATDPIEFSFIGKTSSPLYYIWRSFALYTGLFVFWPLVIYKMFGKQVQNAMPNVFVSLLFIAILNTYVFKFNYGNLDAFFHLDNRDVLVGYSYTYILLPILAAICFILALIRFREHKNHITIFVLAVCMAEIVLSGIKIASISTEYKKFAAARKNEKVVSNKSNIEPIYHLSKTGKNVIVFLWDKAISSFFPYIIKQFPELKEKYSGFVFYPNTVSFSSQTVKAINSTLGGYEYTPENENKRPDVSLPDKHDEAISVMSKLFLDAGFDVTVTDPPASHWNWRDASAFTRFPGINADFVEDRYASSYIIERGETYSGVGTGHDNVVSKHIVMFCLMQASFPALRDTMYNDAYYFQNKFADSSFKVLEKFSFFYYLRNLTDNAAKNNSFIFISTLLTHTPSLLKEPDYIPDNDIEEKSATCGFYNWKTAPSSGKPSDIAHYHVDAAAVLQTAKWFDRLRELEVYDNTRIIIVADHGAQIPTPAFEGMERGYDYAHLNPLLLVKDFGASGEVKTDGTFMTNADTILLAKSGLPLSDINPFTGNSISNACDKTEVRIYPIGAHDDYSGKSKRPWQLHDISPIPAYAVHGNIFDEKNWRLLDD